MRKGKVLQVTTIAAAVLPLGSLSGRSSMAQTGMQASARLPDHNVNGVPDEREGQDTCFSSEWLL